VTPVGDQYFLGLGSNLGDRAGHIGQAIEHLAKLPGAAILAISPAFDSDPVGFADQPKFLNLCLSMSCDLRPPALLQATLAIEQQLGRVRSTNRNGPRTVDIDLLFWAGGGWASEELTLPHPRWAERGFVTVPMRHLLQSPALAKDSRWDSLRADVAQAVVGASGLRAWQGSTPWRPTQG
jgi:2-amino-4-hydroxy-6-hydroxymethyldihydropteridine diphosphokinase